MTQNTPLTELFLFKESALVFAQTSGIVPVTYNGNTYQPYPLGHDDYAASNDPNAQSITIQTHISNPIAQRYFAQAVDVPVTLDIYQQDVNGTDIVWKGRLTGSKQVSDTEVGLQFESVFTSLRRTGLGPRYSRTCRFVLYGPGCGLNPDDWAVSTQLVAVGNQSLTVGNISAYDPQRFVGGMIRMSDSSVRFCNAQNGSVLSLSRPWKEIVALFNGSGYGQSYGGAYGAVSLTIYPGCPHNNAGCKSFSNKRRYGGFEWIPTRNPFTNSVM